MIGPLSPECRELLQKVAPSLMQDWDASRPTVEEVTRFHTLLAGYPEYIRQEAVKTLQSHRVSILRWIKLSSAFLDVRKYRGYIKRLVLIDASLAICPESKLSKKESVKEITRLFADCYGLNDGYYRTEIAALNEEEITSLAIRSLPTYFSALRNRDMRHEGKLSSVLHHIFHLLQAKDFKKSENYLRFQKVLCDIPTEEMEEQCKMAVELGLHDHFEQVVAVYDRTPKLNRNGQFLLSLQFISHVDCSCLLELPKPQIASFCIHFMRGCHQNGIEAKQVALGELVDFWLDLPNVYQRASTLYYLCYACALTNYQQIIDFLSPLPPEEVTRLLKDFYQFKKHLVLKRVRNVSNDHQEVLGLLQNSPRELPKQRLFEILTQNYTASSIAHKGHSVRASF